MLDSRWKIDSSAAPRTWKVYDSWSYKDSPYEKAHSFLEAVEIASKLNNK